MPKKSTRHVKEPGLTKSSHHRSNNPGTRSEQKAKHFRSVRIGLQNGKRWLSLKKRLGLSTDEDVAVYLLDLAESASRYVSGQITSLSLDDTPSFPCIDSVRRYTTQS